jgi:opacity protein-like surface antigen
MSKFSKIAFTACAWAVIAVPGHAADLPTYEPVPIAPAIIGGWYLRGDIGYSNQQVDELDNALYDTAESVDNQYKDFDGAPIFSAGIGYRVNKWFRADITGEYRSKADFSGADIVDDGTGDEFAITANNYDAKKEEWLALVNGYIDVGSWHGISPYIGAGVGAANIEISGFTDSGIGSEGFPAIAYGADHDEWNFAWALYAGLGFEVTPQMTVDIGYRYLDMGDAESGNLVAYDGTDAVDTPMEFKDITSHDVRLGVRYQFN